MNYDFDFKADEEDLAMLKENVKMINAKLVASGYRRMGKEDYHKFIEFMKANPTTALADYIIV